MQPSILSRMVRWLLERIEHFPIPVEEALWAYAYCMTGTPGHEGFSFPLPSHGGGGTFTRDGGGKPLSTGSPTEGHDLPSAGPAGLPSLAVAA